MRNTTSGAKSRAALIAALKEAMLEVVWPTRCAVCDRPGALLCAACEARMLFVNTCLACPACGAPYGMYECTECNDHTRGKSDFDFSAVDTAAYVAIANDVVQRMVATYKDRDDRRLAAIIANFMARYIPPEFLPATKSNVMKGEGEGEGGAASLTLPLITYIPDSKAALARRGFDHMELIARELGRATGLDVACIFGRPQSADQRKLGRAARAKNTKSAFVLLPGAPITRDLILIDDISTTGATIYSAAVAIKQARATAQIPAKTHTLTLGKVLD